MSAEVVVDASVAFAWLLGDEDRDGSLGLLDRARSNTGLHLAVPPIFWSEAANVLAVAVRRARITRQDALAGLSDLMEFGIDEHDVAWDACLATAVETGLSVYDVEYLVLARDLSVSLWTQDARLAHVARARGIRVEP